MRSIILVLSGLLILQAHGLYAQQADSTPPPDANRIQQSLNDSQTLFKAGSADEAAESNLQGICTTPPNSAQWHMECAMNLLRVAFACKENHDDKTAQRVARRVLSHLDRAEKLFAGDADSLSTVHEIRGVVREQLLGDSNQALQSYQAAIHEKPDNPSARNHVHLLQGTTQTNP